MLGERDAHGDADSEGLGTCDRDAWGDAVVLRLRELLPESDGEPVADAPRVAGPLAVGLAVASGERDGDGNAVRAADTEKMGVYDANDAVALPLPTKEADGSPLGVAEAEAASLYEGRSDAVS